MTIRRAIQRMWHRHSAGFLLPDGTVSLLSQSSSNRYLEIKGKAKKLEAIFHENRVDIPQTCDLARLISAAMQLSDSWLTRRAEDIPMSLLFQVAQFDRIADAALPLEKSSERIKYLKKLTSGSLNLLDRQQSQSKDILWELELWSVLLKRGFQASLDEPDIIVKFDDSVIAIPCKKIYSSKGVSKVLSNAVSQIERGFDIGIVALNIDDLIPPQKILQSPNQEHVGNFINQINTDLILQNERHFRKYLSSGRLISAIVSTTLLADLYEEKVRFNNARQSTIWTIPGLSAEKNDTLKKFYSQLMS